MDSKTGFLKKGILIHQLRVDEINISGCLKRRVSKSQKRFVRLVNLPLLQKPTRRLRTEPDTEKKRYRRKKGRGELETPCVSADVDKYEIRTCPKQNTEGCPDLP